MNSEPNQKPSELGNKPVKLYGPKQIVIISVSGLAGIGFFLFRTYHETGQIGTPAIIGAVGGTIILAIITVLTVRKGNRRE